MSKIKVLPDAVVNKIAAGEVVERPSSVVKELVENSIDAGAGRITVDIEAGGTRLIRVSDDGIGMSREDALLAIERHATSKIEKISDIENITTLGFRGEALPSIVSVSQSFIETKRKEDTFGTRLVIDGGTLRDVTEAGRDEGTVIEVKNLLFNLPARRKFLRSEKTELKYIKRILYEVAVSSYGLFLTVMSGGKTVFSFKGTLKREEMLHQIFGDTLTKLMVPFGFSGDGIEVSGFIGKPDTARRSPDHQYIIMNGRPISSKSIMRAVFDGYGPSLLKGMYPAFVLYFEIDPSRVDVNVHPTKREVRIHREYKILQALRENIAQIFHTMIAAPDLGTAPKPETGYSSSARPITMYNLPPDRWQEELLRVQRESRGSQGQNSQIDFAFPIETPKSALVEFPPQHGKEESTDERPVFWQLKDRYIITTVKEGAVIIDQHVAHERVLFEEIMEHFRGRKASAQQLLFPLVLDFSTADYDILEPMIEFLNQIGFGIREFGERSVIVDAVPSWHIEFEDGKILTKYIDEMRLHGRISSGYIEKLAAAIACRSAIKAGKPLTHGEMQYLVDRLFATTSPFVCPHGRPIIIKLTIEELDRRFGR
ncbi:DNA mismatch repair endonuclease MutL [Candidatus Latescibacterota bacterium]